MSDDQRTAEFRRAARALLRNPLLRAQGDTADDFRLVRQHAAELRAWFDRNTGWALRVDATAARLFKVPGHHGEPTHPAREPKGAALPFSRRRYVLLCLALAVLDRGEAQIALGRLADQVALEAADPQLAAAGIGFALETREDRRDLIAVVRLLLKLGVLTRVAGDEDAYLGQAGDALYDVERRVLASLLATRRGPSLVAATAFEDRLAELTDETTLDTGELRNRRLRHTLTRRLLDDPVLYFSELTDEEAAYLTGQRGALTRRIGELTGLVAEVRAEGIAMVDPHDELTDVRMPEQGTHGHLTLLLAGHLAGHGPATVAELRARTRELAAEHAGFWSKSAREPGSENDLVERAVARLTALRLVERVPGGTADGETVVPRPALARYTMGETVVLEPGGRRTARTKTPRRRTTR